MTEHDGPGDPKTEIAGEYFTRSVAQFLSAHVTHERFLMAQAPEVLLDNERKRIADKRKSVAFYAGKLGLSPNQAAKSTMTQFLGQLLKGNYSIHPNVQLDSGAIPVVERVIGDIESGQISFDTPLLPEEEVQMNEALEQRLKFLENLPKTVKEQVHVGNASYKMGEWIIVEKQKENDGADQDAGVGITVPIVGGRITRIHLSRWLPRSFPQDPKIIDSEETTFPIINALFHHEKNPLSSKMRQVVAYPPEKAKELYVRSGSFANNAPSTSDSKLPSLKIEPVDQDYMKELLAEKAGLTPEKLSSMGFAQVLAAVYNFTLGHMSAEAIDGEDTPDSLSYLLGRYRADGVFPGDCNSISTIVVGLGQSLGVSGRRVSGSAGNISAGIGAPHVWAEQYVPSLKLWVPNDPAAGAFYTYPNKEFLYEITGEIYPPDQGVKVMVDYKDM